MGVIIKGGCGFHMWSLSNPPFQNPACGPERTGLQPTYSLPSQGEVLGGMSSVRRQITLRLSVFCFSWI